jgi:hypothetical protein
MLLLLLLLSVLLLSMSSVKVYINTIIRLKLASPQMGQYVARGGSCAMPTLEQSRATAHGVPSAPTSPCPQHRPLQAPACRTCLPKGTLRQGCLPCDTQTYSKWPGLPGRLRL